MIITSNNKKFKIFVKYFLFKVEEVYNYFKKGIQDESF